MSSNDPWFVGFISQAIYGAITSFWSLCSCIVVKLKARASQEKPWEYYRIYFSSSNTSEAPLFSSETAICL